MHPTYGGDKVGSHRRSPALASSVSASSSATKTGPVTPQVRVLPPARATLPGWMPDEATLMALGDRHAAVMMVAEAEARARWTAVFKALQHPPTPAEVRALCDALDQAKRCSLRMARHALADWLRHHGDGALKVAAVQDMLRDVFISVMRNKRSGHVSWSVNMSYFSAELRETRLPAGLLFMCDLLEVSDTAAAVVLGQLVRAAARVPADLAEPMLRHVLEREAYALPPGMARGQLLPIIQTMVRAATNRLDHALQPRPLWPGFGVHIQLGWTDQGGTYKGQVIEQLLQICCEHGAKRIEFLAPLLQEILAHGQTLPVRMRQALVTALLGVLGRRDVAVDPALDPVRWVLPSPAAPHRAAWPLVRSVLAGLLPHLTRFDPEWQTPHTHPHRVLAALAGVPAVHKPMALAWLHAGLVISESEIFVLPAPLVLECQRRLIAAEAEFDDDALTYAMVGIEVGLGWTASRDRGGGRRLAAWPKAIAELARAPAIAERLQRCREQAVRLVTRVPDLLDFPGLIDSDRLYLLEIILLPPGIGERPQMEQAVMSLDPYHALGRFRAPLMVLASLDHQAELSVDAFARVHAALLDRVQPASEEPAVDRKHAGAAKAQASLDGEDDDSALMAQALGAWRLDGIAKGYTQPIADQWAFLQNHQETSGLFYLYGHRPQDLRADYIAAHRSRIEHALRQMDVARRQVRKRFPQGSEEARYLLQPLDQFARALRGGLKRIGVEPALRQSRSRADGKRSGGSGQGPDPSAPARL